MSTKERRCYPLDPKYSASFAELGKLIPQGFTQPVYEGGLWNSCEVLNGREHNPSHPVIVTGLVYNLGRFLNQYAGWQLNLDALATAAIFHDVCRHDDCENDHFHGVRAGALLEKLNPSGELSLHTADFTEAQRIIVNHQKRHDEVPQEDLNLRFFIFCDVLSMVRYEGNGNHFALTGEELDQILPLAFNHNEIYYLIDKTREWHRRCETLIQRGIDPLSAALYTGRNKGFFTDGEEDKFYSIYLIKQKAQKKRPISQPT